MANPVDHPLAISFGDASVRLRKDLQLVTIRRGLQTTHIVKDPVNLKYFEIDEHEMALLKRIDGKQSWDEVCPWFNRRFPPLRLSHQALQATIWRLYQQGLLVTVAMGQGRRVADRTRQSQRQEWTHRLSQPWIIRLPGINPGPWLGLANGLFGWIFSPIFVGIASIVLFILLMLIFAQYEAITRLRPGSVDFFSRENLILLTLVIIVTKVMHELGHAIAAYRHGCECHEMGVLLLAGLPSLYCDVSDAWTLPSRWNRITVSLGGVWVEILIAALAFAVWTSSVPGVVHAISFNVMVVCSIGTLMFNANPLVRYDGYYVLMDLAGISNLGQRSQEAISRLFSNWVLGTFNFRRLDVPEIPGWCLVYAAVSMVYRVVLSFAILWGLHLALKPFSLSALVWIVATGGLTFGSVKMLRSGTVQVRSALAMGIPFWRMAIGVAFLSGGLVICATIPLPWYVFGEAVMEPANRQILVTAVPGRLRERKDSGTPVKAGELIARFENQDIEREAEQMDADLRAQRERLQALLSRRNQDLRASEQIPAAEAAIVALEHRRAFLLEERRRLEIRATEDSVIYPAPVRLADFEKGELMNWTGSLLDSSNQNVWANAGDLFCQLGAGDQLEAIAVLAQDDLEAVAVGQRADIFLRSSGKTIRGEIAKISHLELDSKDESNVALALPQMVDHYGRNHGKWYQVQIRCLTPLPKGTMVRSRSKVRIHAGSRTIGQWIALQFFKTFRWHA